MANSNEEETTEDMGPVVERLVEAPVKKLTGEKGESLELLMRDGEPAVLVDGKFVVRYSTLARQLKGAKIKDKS